MVALAYTSDALVPFTMDALLELERQAAEKNQLLGVTGYLFHRNQRFLQYLEGPQEVVDCLMDRIKADSRHLIQRLLELGPIEERLFPYWHMRYLHNPPRETAEDELQFLIDHGDENDESPASSMTQAVHYLNQRIANMDWGNQNLT